MHAHTHLLSSCCCWRARSARTPCTTRADSLIKFSRSANSALARFASSLAHCRSISACWSS
jgi:hypothetical protein